MIEIKRCFFIFHLFLTLSSFSQTYNIKHYTVQDGLLHSFVNDIIQDSKGNVWIATGGGLCKFNGVDFESYTTKNGLNFSRLLCLAEDDKNNIWIGSTKGVNLFDGSAIYSLQNTNLGDNVLAFEKSKSGKMWIATNNGISKASFKNKEILFEKLPFDFGNSRSQITFQDRVLSTFLLETKKQQLFIGLNNALYIYQNGKLDKIKLQESIEANTACELPNGDIIIGTNKGLYKCENKKLYKVENENINEFAVLKIKRNKDKLWMLGKWTKKSEDELFLVSISLTNPNYFRKIGIVNGLISNPTSLFIDHEKNIWTGSNGGLSVLRGETFVNYTKNHGLVGNKIWGIYQAPDNKMWIGMLGQGLSIMNENGTIKNFTLENGLPDLYVSKIFQDTKNEFYLGTAKKGLCVANYNSLKKTYSFRQLSTEMNSGDIRIDDIIVDKNNTMWVASSKGLFYSKDHVNFKHQPLFKGDSNQVILYNLHISKKGVLWISTKNNGLFVQDNHQFKQVLHNYSDVVGITCICEDYDGNIWISAQTKGILNTSDKKQIWISDKDGLASKLIYVLQPDKHGNLWIGSNLGLDKLNCTKYNKFKIIELRHYDINDGLQDLEINMNGSIEDHQGNVWFATNNGLLKYNYQYDISNRVPPITNILSLKLYSKSVNWNQYADSILPWNHLPVNPVLPYNQNHLTFEFVGISYKNPKEIKYSWILEEFDNKWVPSTTSRQAIYSNLPPGKYVFKLISSNNNGVWNREIIEFPFEILSPFWATWWFRILALVSIISIITTYFKWRTQSLKSRQKELEITVEQRTMEISLQKKIVEGIHLDITKSIDYAERIQSSLLPNAQILEKHFNDYFIVFKPRDVVSGDFYWWANVEGRTVITASDCTGHGVPGAFMSTLGISLIREIVLKEYITHPGVILRRLRKEIMESLKQKDDFEQQKDGMDMALISIDHETNMMQYAGANNPIYIIRQSSKPINLENKNDRLKIICTENNTLYEIKPDKMPIGFYYKMDKFITHDILLEKGDQIYLFSDGILDQFGGPLGRKFMSTSFKKTLIENAHRPMADQKEILSRTFDNWKGEKDQIDDVVVIAIKI